MRARTMAGLSNERKVSRKRILANKPVDASFFTPERDAGRGAPPTPHDQQHAAVSRAIHTRAAVERAAMKRTRCRHRCGDLAKHRITGRTRRAVLYAASQIARIAGAPVPAGQPPDTAWRRRRKCAAARQSPKESGQRVKPLVNRPARRARWQRDEKMPAPYSNVGKQGQAHGPADAGRPCSATRKNVSSIRAPATREPSP